MREFDRRALLKAAVLLPTLTGAARLSTAAERQLATLPDVLTIDELATLLRCSHTTIRRGLAARTFPVAPLDCLDWKHRWSKHQVARWLTANEWPARGRA